MTTRRPLQPATWLMALCALLLLAMLTLHGCAQLGVPAPQTTDQRIAVAVASITAVRQSTQTLLVAGRISAADASNVQAQADNAIAAAQIARTIAPTDPAAADAKLQSTIQILQALQAYLASKQGGKP